MIASLALGALVFAAMFVVDYAHARYVAALGRSHHRAACWASLQWMSATAVFVVAIKVTLAVLPFELAGLYLGTWCGSRAAARVAGGSQDT